LNELKNKLELWKSELSSLITWSQFVNYRKQCLNTVAAPFIRIIDNDGILAEDLLPAFKGNYTDNLLKITFREKRSCQHLLKNFRTIRSKNSRNLTAKLFC